MISRNKIVILLVLAGILIVGYFLMSGNNTQKESSKTDAERIYEKTDYMEDYNSVKHINPNKTTGVVSLLLSDIIDELHFVKLQKSGKESLIDQWPRFYMSESYIGTVQYGTPYLLFEKKSGKFLRKIGNIGRGPGEYHQTPYYSCIDEKNDRIYLACSGNILEYTLDGEYIGSIDVPAIESNRFQMSVNKDGSFTIFLLPFPNDANMIVKFNRDGEVIYSEPNRIGGKADYSFDVMTSNYDSGKVIYYCHTSPVIYEYNKNKERVKPLFAIDLESKVLNASIYGFPEYVLGHTVRMEREGNNLVGQPEFYYTVDKKSLEVKQVKSFINDFYGDFPMKPFEVRENLFIQYWHADELKEAIQKYLSENKSLDASIAEKLKSLDSSLKEDDNPVVFYGKLK